jgi:hypothetical protein
MKDIDKLLSQPMPTPKRPLSTNFTKEIAMKIKQPRQTGWQRLRSNAQSLILTKVGAASLASIALISGTVAAVSLWPKPVITPTVNKPLPSGNHIVGYDATNCNYLRALDGTRIGPKTEKIYYEVHKDSKLTDQQIQDSLRAVCEENMSNNAISALLKELPNTPTGSTFSTEALFIKAVTKNSLTFSLDPHYDATDYTLRPELTYTKFDTDMLVRDQDNKIAYADLKAGDTIKLIVRDDSMKFTETTEGYNPFNYPEHITVLAILRVPPLTADPTIMQRAYATDLVRLESCANSPTGLCRVYDFAPRSQ